MEIYIVEMRDYEENPYKEFNRFYASLDAAAKFMFRIRDIWPKREAWIWKTCLSEDFEIVPKDLICHLNSLEPHENA